MRKLGWLMTALFLLVPFAASMPSSDPPIAPVGGWLIIHGGGSLEPEIRDRFIALAGGLDAKVVMIPTALSDEDIPGRSVAMAQAFGLRNYTELHTRDRAVANSDAFVEPLRHASAVWIDGGRPWRLVDAYAGTAVEREIKALLARGGVVFGSSAGASIQASFLVRGAPATPTNPEGDNTVVVDPRYDVGFGLLPDSAIDQHVEERSRETDLDPVVATHPELLGIGIDQSAAIIVHGDTFFVVGGQVAIHDDKQHVGGAEYYLLSSGQEFNWRTRSVVPDGLPLTLSPITAVRTARSSGAGYLTAGRGVLSSRATAESERVMYQCEATLYSIGNNSYPARPDGANRLKVEARELNTNKLNEYTCTY